MAGLARSAGVAAILGLGTPAILGQTPGNTENEKPATSKNSKSDAKASDRNEEGTKKNQPVRLELRIAGLGVDGCDVAIKPANPTCRFRAIKRRVNASGDLTIDIKDMEVRGVNRTCSLSITVNEPGQKPRTVLRGFRLESQPAVQDSEIAYQTFACWLSAPSKLVRIEESKTIRK